MPQQPAGFVPDGFVADTPTYQPRNILEEGRRSAATSGLKEDPGAVAQWFETTLRPMLERVAHPQTVSDIAALLVPDANLSGAMKAGQAAVSNVRQMPVRQPIAGALDAASAAMNNPIAGSISPRAPHVGKMLGAAADMIRPAASAPVAAIAEEVVPAVTATAKAFSPNAALQAARDVFTAARETPRAAELSNAMELIRRGKSPEEALAVVLRNRPTAAVSPAEAFAQRFGLPTEAERIAAQDARYAAGKVKTPSAETARRSRP